jgi:hypothetical protein
MPDPMEEISIACQHTGPHAWQSPREQIVHKVGLGSSVQSPSQLDAGGPAVIELLGHVTVEVPCHAVMHGAAVSFNSLKNLVWLGEGEHLPTSSVYEPRKLQKQAGAELCQAQDLFIYFFIL